MVIHEDYEAPIEVPVIKKPVFVIPKNYVMIKNHIREVAVSDDSQKQVSEITNHSKCSVEKKGPKQLCVLSQMASQESTLYFNEEPSNEISKSDLEELVTVYKRCKRILKKIETKYGHLLNLDDETQHNSTESENGTKKRKSKLKINLCNENLDSETQCTCLMKKKIVFDDDGDQVHLPPSKSDHICFKRSKNFYNNQMGIVDNEETKNDKIKTTDLKVEYEESNSLPDDIVSLSKLLKNDEISVSCRKNIVHKIKMLTQEHNFELKLSKQTIIEQLKESPEDVMEFKGSNLFSLPGYLEY